jgi:hypothetical protein
MKIPVYSDEELHELLKPCEEGVYSFIINSVKEIISKTGNPCILIVFGFVDKKGKAFTVKKWFNVSEPSHDKHGWHIKQIKEFLEFIGKEYNEDAMTEKNLVNSPGKFLIKINKDNFIEIASFVMGDEFNDDIPF